MTSQAPLPTRRRFRPALLRDRRGLAMLEFALILPVFLSFCITGIELGYYVMAVNRVQRMASMTADLVAQSGVGQIGATEAQIYDLFSAVDLTARPFDLRGRGRVIISSVIGADSNGDSVPEPRFLWQRFDGNYTAAAPVLGCATTNPVAILPRARVLPLNEILFHVQVTYNYQPIFGASVFKLLDFSPAMTRTATYRARSTQFRSPTADARFPAKSKCTTANGL